MGVLGADDLNSYEMVPQK